MEDDWDLHAVVRSCTTSNTTITSTTTDDDNKSLFCYQNLPEPEILTRYNDNNNIFSEIPQVMKFEKNKVHTEFTCTGNGTTDFEELDQLCKPFFIKEPIWYTKTSVTWESRGLQDSPPSQQHQQQQFHKFSNMKLIQPKRPLPSLNGSTTCTLHAQSPRTKRRKNQLKKVCQVAADALSSDMWSWRKYGQKPIKGSPYPRGYYKCSTSKGCLARKQVERNRSDPNMFIVTYTAEHNHPMPTHRNSLAGISRNKTVNSNKPITSSPESSPAINSPAPENQESSREEKDDIFEDDDDDEFGVADKMEPEDDFFDGLDELEIPATGDRSPEKFRGTSQFPWLVNNAATTAAGGI